MTRAVFLDRDGVINRNCPRAHDYIKSPDELELLPGVGEAIRELNEAGFLVIVATNQRGVARGMMTVEDLDAVNGEMESQLRGFGARIDAVYVCPHNDGECDCRKPKPGLLLKAIDDFGIDVDGSWMVGDHGTDVEAGRAAGVRTLLIGAGECSADRKCGDLREASRLIIDWSKE